MIDDTCEHPLYERVVLNPLEEVCQRCGQTLEVDRE